MTNKLFVILDTINYIYDSDPVIGHFSSLAKAEKALKNYEEHCSKYLEDYDHSKNYRFKILEQPIDRINIRFFNPEDEKVYDACITENNTTYTIVE